MDDKEYYTLMNRMPSAAILEMLKKKNSIKSKSQLTEKSFGHLESYQGREDAEMLMMEKQQNED